MAEPLPLGPRPRPRAPKGCRRRAEAEYQRQLIDLGETMGYRVMHVRPTVAGLGPRNQRWQTATSVKGWPDLTLWKPGRFVMLELKAHDGRLEPHQERILRSLVDAGIDAAVTWPWELEAVATLLRGPA